MFISITVALEQTLMYALYVYFDTLIKFLSLSYHRKERTLKHRKSLLGIYLVYRAFLRMPFAQSYDNLDFDEFGGSLTRYYNASCLPKTSALFRNVRALLTANNISAKLTNQYRS